MKDGTVLVTREQCDRWRDDLELREAVLEVGTAGGNQLFLVCTEGGYVVDVWEVNHWQSGATDDGDVGWSQDMYAPHDRGEPADFDRNACPGCGGNCQVACR